MLMVVAAPADAGDGEGGGSLLARGDVCHVETRKIFFLLLSCTLFDKLL